MSLSVLRLIHLSERPRPQLPHHFVSLQETELEMLDELPGLEPKLTVSAVFSAGDGFESRYRLSARFRAKTAHFTIYSNGQIGCSTQRLDRQSH